MIPELGHLALILAFLLALVQGTLPIVGAARRIPAWMALARPVARGQFLFIAAAWCCLAYSFVTSDFSVLNVATNSNSQLPIQYKFAATWGSHEGSMMLWVFMLVVLDARRLAQEPAPARRDGRPRDRRDGTRQRRLPAVHADDLESVRARVPRAGRWPRLESAAAGPGHGHASADAVHGLRRLLGGVLVRDRARCSAAVSTRHGRAGRARGPRSRGASSRSAS